MFGMEEVPLLEVWLVYVGMVMSSHWSLSLFEYINH
jgi:hypothetical protein